MEDVKAAVEGGFGGVVVVRVWGFGSGGRSETWQVIRIAKQHEDVPDAELGGEGDGVVEEREVPAGAVGGGSDVKFGLYSHLALCANHFTILFYQDKENSPA